MPRTKIVFYKDYRERVPVLDWLEDLGRTDRHARNACIRELELLSLQGHELRRPHCDLLRHGIYELRCRHRRQQYRMLYFFHGKAATVVSHGLVKERRVPPKEIDKTTKRKKKFEADPKKHTHKET